MRLARGFTAEEDEIIRTHSRLAAADLIRVSYTTVKYRWRELFDKEGYRRAKQAKRANDRRAYIPTSRSDSVNRRTPPSPEALAERDRREAAPYRDYTAAFLGDPPVGYSALDRR